MIRVNLLPFRAARKKENIKRQVSIYFLTLVLCVIGLVFVNLNLGKKTKRLNNRISVTEKELKTYKEINKEIDAIKKKLEVLKAKTAIIEELEANRAEPVMMLDSMTDIIVPKRMWFKSLKIREKMERENDEKSRKKRKKRKRKKRKKEVRQAPKKTVDISVAGIALDNKTVADFMTRLEQSRMYENIDLQSIKQVNIRKVDLKEFVITFNRVQPEKTAEKNKIKIANS